MEMANTAAQTAPILTDRILLSTPAEGVALITLNCPERHNALDIEAMRALAAAVHHLAADPTVRVVIVTGAGEAAFCSGGDLNDLAHRLTEDDARGMITLMGEALLALERLPIPVIAAVNGYALGGGSEIALACDIRIVDERARLGFVQARRGLITGWGGGQRLLRLVGYARAMELLLMAQPLDADGIRAYGLANRIVPPRMALAAALEMAAQIVSLDPAVVRAIKGLLRAGVDLPYEHALEAERDLFPALWVGAAHQAKMREFLERPEKKP